MSSIGLGPKLATWHTGLFKEIPIASECVRFQFRAEFFNVLNHANFYNPGSRASTNSVVRPTRGDGFGTLTVAQDPRIGQLARKLLF